MPAVDELPIEKDGCMCCITYCLCMGIGIVFLLLGIVWIAGKIGG